MNKTIEINETLYVLNFLEKDTGEEFVKWHTFTMDNMLNANDFYIVQIIQEKDKKEYDDETRNDGPEFYVEYFEKDSNGCNLGEWDYIDHYFNKEDARKLKELLIDLSDRELRGEFEEEKVYGRDRLGRR